MMKTITNLVYLAFLIDNYNALSISRALKYNTTNKIIGYNGTNDGGFIDISGLGWKAFGVPSKESGEKLASWTEDSLVNPEEVGDYFEGDILMPPVLLRNGLINLSSRWPDAFVPYDFEGNFSNEERSLMLEAIDQYHNYTCIRFVPYEGEEDYLAITNDGIGCSSAIGKLGGRQTINLAPACIKIGTIIHELMHTIGFMHEVSREDRDDYITILEGNIKDDRLEDFKAYQSNTFDIAYDYGSIMHQSEYAFAKTPNKKTIQTKKNYEGVTIGQRSGFSQSDIMKINTMYKCEM